MLIKAAATIKTLLALATTKGSFINRGNRVIPIIQPMSKANKAKAATHKRCQATPQAQVYRTDRKSHTPTPIQNTANQQAALSIVAIFRPK